MAKAKTKFKLTLKDILNAKPELTEVSIKGLSGGVVYVKEFSTDTRDQYAAAVAAQENVHAVVIMNGICDEDGDAMFTHEDVIELRKIRSDIHDQLFDAVIGVCIARVSNAAKK